MPPSPLGLPAADGMAESHAPHHGGAFANLLGVLPKPGQSGVPQTEIRAVLSPLLERVIETRRSPAPLPLPAEPSTCPNCGGAATSPRSPYCGPACRDTASFVRQFRHAVADGSIFDSERQIALGQALWRLQGGGFPHRQSLVPARIVAKVIERDGGVCSLCGAPATEIDHTGSG
jgi:hypothetical protein